MTLPTATRPAADRVSEFADFNQRLRARQRAAALGQGRGRPDRHPPQGGGVPPGQDDALPLQADGGADDRSARCWSPTAWSAATRWPTCRKTARCCATCSRQGVDVYAVDWGNPTRSDRWLTFDDYVDDYLNDCVEFICRAHGIDSINLLGICEGGVFSLCYAALLPGAGQEPDPHHHAGRLPRGPGGRPHGPRLHQPVDAQPDAPRTSTG